MSTPNAQLYYAHQLAMELEDAGHDDITAEDILDCLGTAGLALVEAENADVSVAYLRAVDKDH